MDVREMVEGLRAGSEQTAAAFYAELRKAYFFRIYTRLRAPDYVEDCLHQAFIEALRYIRSGQMREPAAMWGAVAVIVERSICRLFRQRTAAQELQPLGDGALYASVSADPEQRALARERQELLRRGMTRLNAKDRQLIQRCFIDDEPAAQVMADMGLTDTQFRLAKSRAKRKLYAIRRIYQRRK